MRRLCTTFLIIASWLMFAVPAATAQVQSCTSDVNCTAPAKCLGTVTHTAPEAGQNAVCDIQCTSDSTCPAGATCQDKNINFGVCRKAAAPTTGTPSGSTGQGSVSNNQIHSGSVLTLPLPLGDITLPQLIGRIIKQLLSIVGAIALLLFVWGGISWMLAAGVPEKVASAKKIIVAAISGLIAIFVSYAVLNLIINAFSKP
jgi:hypothetical protein